MTNTKKMAPVELQLAEAVNRNANPYEGDPMTTSVTASPNEHVPIDAFEASIHVGSLIVSPITIGDLVGVVLNSPADNIGLWLLPERAQSLAAALQAVAVYQLEQQPREITRRTEPGQSSFEGAL